MTRPLCRHCGTRVANRARGLCYPCYHAPAVRDLYPTDPRYYRTAAHLERVGPVPPAPAPTAAHVGTPERIAVLAARAAAGVELSHPDDARSLPPDPEPGTWWRARRGRWGMEDEE